MTEQLVRYDAACKAIAAARTTDEAMKITDGAAMLRAYAKQAKNRDLEIDAAEIRIRAERRVGELIAAQQQSVGLAKGARAKGTRRGSDHDPRRVPPTLADAGIDKQLANRARKLTALTTPEFEGRLRDWRDRMRSETRVSLPIVSEPPAVLRGDDRIKFSPGAELCSRLGTLLDRVDSLAEDDRRLVLTFLDRSIADLRRYLHLEVIA